MIFRHCHTNEFTGFCNTWNVNGANIYFEDSSIDEGKALNITKNTDKQFYSLPNIFDFFFETM